MTKISKLWRNPYMVKPILATGNANEICEKCQKKVKIIQCKKE